ncbi:ABC transporter substrate-binding protein [Halorussus sp. MSC15.2]|uniref:ABC transporter substrate-binding protein n=1 Tax=Halorussus sp. MSC15.2 TaxID=2283638 RepID=UPI0013D378ED|nr:ABC transporter substrate-binding protein [Halorussus sp. MSC15.2]NEU57759.1 ABC transporter substrate-binding protein [Halorussus sp. MSC15.2]
MVNDGNDYPRNRVNGKQARSTENNDKRSPVSSVVDRRRFLRVAGTGVAATSLAGCTGGSQSSDSKTQQLQGPIKVGVLAPEPGNNPIGASIANSAKLAASQLNENGGVLGADVEVVVKDTKEDPATGKRKYQELTVGQKVDLTTGVFTSEVLLNLMSSIAQQQTLHMSTGAATPEATRKVAENYDRFKYFFRTGPVNSHFLGQNMVDFAKANFESMGWDSVAILAEDYKWTEPISKALNGSLSEAGIDVPVNKRYAGGTENFSPIYDEVQSAGVDAAYVVMAHTGTSAVVQWAKQQRPFEFGGIHVPMQFPSYYKATNGACRYAVTQNSATPTSEITDKTVPYANSYKEEYGKYPVYTGYITFDAVKQYASAVKEAGSKESEKVIPALENSSFTGTTSPALEYYGKDSKYPHDVKYGKKHAWPVWLQWQKTDGTGSQEVIWPDNLSTTEYKSPPWV